MGQQFGAAGSESIRRRDWGSRGKAGGDDGRQRCPIVKVAEPRKRRRYNLERLINGITEENRQPEIDWGRPLGNEIW
jgi:hypothetical protein